MNLVKKILKEQEFKKKIKEWVERGVDETELHSTLSLITSKRLPLNFVSIQPNPVILNKQVESLKNRPNGRSERPYEGLGALAETNYKGKNYKLLFVYELRVLMERKGEQVIPSLLDFTLYGFEIKVNNKLVAQYENLREIKNVLNPKESRDLFSILENKISNHIFKNIK